MKKKRKINKKLLAAAFILILLTCGVCMVGMTRGSVYIKTKGTPTDNINTLFASIVSGDGNACLRCTDSYQKIDFDASGESGAVSAICGALQQSYSYEQKESGPDEDKTLTSVNDVQFSSLDLTLLSADVAEKYEGYIFDTVKEYDTNVTQEDGNYIDEVYEKAYEKAVIDALSTPEKYYTTETLELNSAYSVEKGGWLTDIDKKFTQMLLGELSGNTSSDNLSVPETVKNYVNNSIALLKGEPIQNQNQFSVSRDAIVGEKPDETKYVSIPVDHADRVLNIISYARASGLLGDQEVIFDPGADFYPEDIVCYCDDSILAICWKEYIKGCVCNCMEIKLADASQMKRKLTGDTYGASKLDTVSNMSAATNAVCATSADYYAFRDIGVTVYQGELYRYQLSCEVLMIDENGRFVFYYPDGKSEKELQDYINEQNIQFSLAFGPVLIDNYKPRYYVDGYALGLGEMKECYSRSAFGEFDDLHYLFMTSGYSEKTSPPENLDAFIDILLTKNLKNVYNLDGGQTAEIVINNEAYNQIDYGGERQVSDMIYYVTAVPGKTDE